MRIGGGEFRGRVLRAPKGEATRPTSGLARETLLNILLPCLPDARLLDLYAGSGSVGLEAISRGAQAAVFVEISRPALDCLRENIAMLGMEKVTGILPLPVERALPRLIAEGACFDIIFLDPPFADRQACQTVLEIIAGSALLAPAGVVVAQHASRVKLPEQLGCLTRYREKIIGDNALSFYRMDATFTPGGKL